mmetsp:Transcript_19435/g.74531  ORF Transcript_19435/g.74531 Transcript_19435/m.74531 type:complete len:447 (-) Transcript_19435:367-1707(-)
MPCSSASIEGGGCDSKATSSWNIGRGGVRGPATQGPGPRRDLRGRAPLPTRSQSARDRPCIAPPLEGVAGAKTGRASAARASQLLACSAQGCIKGLALCGSQATAAGPDAGVGSSSAASEWSKQLGESAGRAGCLGGGAVWTVAGLAGTKGGSQSSSSLSMRPPIDLLTRVMAETSLTLSDSNTQSALGVPWNGPECSWRRSSAVHHTTRQECGPAPTVGMTATTVLPFTRCKRAPPVLPAPELAPGASSGTEATKTATRPPDDVGVTTAPAGAAGEGLRDGAAGPVAARAGVDAGLWAPSALAAAQTMASSASRMRPAARGSAPPGASAVGADPRPADTTPRGSVQSTGSWGGLSDASAASTAAASHAVAATSCTRSAAGSGKGSGVMLCTMRAAPPSTGASLTATDASVVTASRVPGWPDAMLRSTAAAACEAGRPTVLQSTRH